jgi:hypothetical protein
VLVPAPGLAIEVLEGECVAFQPKETRAFYLNATAALVLGLCDGVRSTDEICQMIRDGYPEAPPSLEDEVIGVVAELEEYGLLVHK